MSEYNAEFLWPHEEGSIEEAGWMFANSSTPEMQKQWWDILVQRIAQREENTLTAECATTEGELLLDDLLD